MSVTESFEGRCCDCDATYQWSVGDPTAKERTAHRNNRDVWASTHYETTGHHRFRYSNVKEFDVSMARVANPDQLRIADDPDNAHLDPANWGMKS